MVDQSANPRVCALCSKPLTNSDLEMCEECIEKGSENIPPADKASITSQIKAEIERLKELVNAFSWQEIKEGDWFNKVVQYMLKSYAEEIMAQGGVEFFRKKYPGETIEMIAQRLCSLATNYAALAGGSSGAASSAAFAATIGTAGGAGVIAVPTTLTLIAAEMFYTTQLQIRLIYDLSILYGRPVNLDDPEDLYRIFCMAYGISAATGSAGSMVKATAPEVARAQLRSLIHGNTKAIQAMATKLLGPRIGRTITQKAILRTAVPVVGIAISASWNYVSTRLIAERAHRELRSIARLRDEVKYMQADLYAQRESARLIIESMLVLFMSDNHIDDFEHQLYTSIAQALDISEDQRKELEETVNVSLAETLTRLSKVQDPALVSVLIRCWCLVVVADGQLSDMELKTLQQFYDVLGQKFDITSLQEKAREFGYTTPVSTKIWNGLTKKLGFWKNKPDSTATAS